MLSHCETELICDLAEYYHVLDMWALPVKTLAALASGLRDDSRTKMKMRGEKITVNQILWARTVDYLALLAWIDSGAARQKKPQPTSIEEALKGTTKKKPKSNIKSYRTPEEFDAAWKELTGS